MAKYYLMLLSILAFFSPPVYALPAAAKASYFSNIAAKDMPGDSGGAAVLIWDVPTGAGEDIIYRVMATADIEDESSWRDIIEFSAADKTVTANNIKLPFWVWDEGEKQFAIQIKNEALQISGARELKEKAETIEAISKKLKKEALLLEKAAPNINKKLLSFSKQMDKTTAELREEAELFPKNKDHYIYCKAIALKQGKIIAKSDTLKVLAESNWFRADRLNTMFMTLLIVFVFLYSLSRARKGESFIRRINGLDAIEEAVGRATEMGKPIFYTTGLYDIDAISTIASVFILSEVAKKVASYDCGLIVPHKQFLAMSVCREVTKQAYTEAGRPDSYKESANFFLNPDQFAYATGVEAIITREKPAACFYMGSFAAEALLMSEIGTTVGAIQVAGTDSEDQLPFFFTSCDYTLIGEELYAAGAYLSKDPLLISALKVQDFGKLLFMILALIAVILILISLKTGNTALLDCVKDALTGY